MRNTDRQSWSTRLFDQLVEAGVTLFAYVPDAGNKRLIELADAEFRTRAVLLTSEEEGVAICDDAAFPVWPASPPDHLPPVGAGFKPAPTCVPGMALI